MRAQMNTPLFRERRIDLLRRVRPALHPIVWVDEGADLDDENASMMMKKIIIPSIALKVDGFMYFRDTLIRGTFGASNVHELTGHRMRQLSSVEIKDSYYASFVKQLG